MNKFRILIATPFISKRPIRGYETIVLALVEDLHLRNFNIDLISLDSDGTRKFEFNEFEKLFHKIILIRVSKFQRFINLVLGFFRKESIQISYFKGNQLDEKNALHHINNTNYDLMISITIRMARYVTENISNSFKVIHLIDPHILNYSRSIEWENPLMKLIYTLDYSRLLNFESKILKKFHHRTLISDEDIKEMSLIYNLKFEKLKYGSRNEFIGNNFHDFQERDKNLLIITGNMAYKPNIIGVEWFCTKVFPLLLNQFPNLKLYVIGSNPHPRLIKLGSNNIIFTGYLENMTSFTSKAIVSVCPVKHRIGVQTKILEAFSQQLPVIATSNSNSGINANHKNEILIADDPEEFLKQFYYLLNEDNWKLLAHNSGQLFLNGFNLKKNIQNSNTIILENITSFNKN